MSFRSLSVRYSPTQSSRSSVAWTASTSTSGWTEKAPGRSDASSVQAIATTVQRQRQGKDLAIVVVVPQRSLDDVERRCRPSGLKFWKGRNKSLVLFTTPETLQFSLLDAQSDPERRRLTMLISDQIAELTEPFEVCSGITTLKIIRPHFPSDHDDLRDDSSSVTDDDELLLAGASTFHNIRLDDWLSTHRDRHLHLGAGVRVRIESLDDFLSLWSYSSNASSSVTLVVDSGSGPQQAAVREQLARMEGLATDAPAWWERWAAPVAGVAASSPPGVAAVAVGAAVGLAVYFVPWDAVFRFLREKVLPPIMAAARTAKDAVVGLIERLMSWLKKLLGAAALEGEKEGKEEGNEFDHETHVAFAMNFPL